MQKVSLKKLSLLGGVLLLASAVVSAFIPVKPKTIEDCNGVFELSTIAEDNGQGIDKTCTAAVDEANCWTCTGLGTGAGTSSGTSGAITTAADTKFSDGVIYCATVS